MLVEKKEKMLAKVMAVDQWFANDMVIGSWQELYHGALVVDNLVFLEFMLVFLIILIGFNKLLIVIDSSLKISFTTSNIWIIFNFIRYFDFI